MPSLPRRILLTGARGFVGHHLTASLARAYSDAVLFAPRLDVRNREQVVAAVREAAPDVCIHLAGISTVRAAECDEDSAWAVNLHGTLHVARTLLRYAPECQLLFASSADAYGFTFGAGRPVTEDMPLAPLNVYAATKAAADLALGSMAAKGLRVVRIRPFNHTGPGQSVEFVVAAFAQQVSRIAAGLQPPLLRIGNADTWRDFLDVRDVCAGYLACIAQRDRLPPGTILNFASGKAHKILDIVHDLQTIAGVTVEPRVDPARVRPSDVPRTCGDSSRARQLLGWTPVIPWEQTLRDVMDDWRLRIHAGP